MALVLSRIRLPVCSASPRASSHAGTSSALAQPYPSPSGHQIIRCTSKGASVALHGPHRRGCIAVGAGRASKGAGITVRAWVAP